ncbi:MAG: GNAT family N-acetyltransferase [Thermoplasmata archaeon]
MSRASPELRPTIDRVWLEAAARADPLAHAYAVWDLDRFPDRIRFISAVRGESTEGYLLVWLGHPAAPIVHWVGGVDDAGTLVGGLPPRPLVVIGPEEVRAVVERARGPAKSFPLLALLARPTARRGTGVSGLVRRLTGADRPELVRLVSGETELVAADYPGIDPDHDSVWGAFEGDRLSGVARAVVRRPEVWVLGNVYVRPSARGRGLGLALVHRVLDAAAGAGVPVGLFVREDRPAARAMYARAGFRPQGRRVWVDAGAGLAP